jgi:hypothetical protein
MLRALPPADEVAVASSPSGQAPFRERSLTCGEKVEGARDATVTTGSKKAA